MPRGSGDIRGSVFRLLMIRASLENLWAAPRWAASGDTGSAITGCCARSATARSLFWSLPPATAEAPTASLPARRAGSSHHLFSMFHTGEIPVMRLILICAGVQRGLI